MLDGPVKVSVAICTWNRCDLLHQTLTGMRQLVVDKNLRWELIVVNNNSTDGTEEVFVRHKDSFSNMRWVLETEQGLSQARNRALREAAGELIAFIDDDVIVEPDWLSSFCLAADRWPDAGYFAGAVFPWYEEAPRTHVASVLNELANGAYLGLNLAPVERTLTISESPRGANMLIRNSAAKGLLFDPAFGRTKDQVWFGDETDFCNRISQRGHSGVWVPSAKLRHFVPRRRVENEYLREYFVGLGTSMVRQGNIQNGKCIASIPRWVLPAYVKSFFGRFLMLCAGDRVGSFREKTMQWRYQGIIREFRRRALHSEKSSSKETLSQ